jgi:hypothetical protein
MEPETENGYRIVKFCHFPAIIDAPQRVQRAQSFLY